MISIVKYLSEQSNFPDLAALHSRMAASHRVPPVPVVPPIQKPKELVSIGDKHNIGQTINSLVKSGGD